MGSEDGPGGSCTPEVSRTPRRLRIVSIVVAVALAGVATLLTIGITNTSTTSPLPPAPVIQFLGYESLRVQPASRDPVLDKEAAIGVACASRADACEKVRQAWLVDITEPGTTIGNISVDHLTVWVVRSPEPHSPRPRRAPGFLNDPRHWQYDVIVATTGRWLFGILAYESNASPPDG